MGMEITRATPRVLPLPNEGEIRLKLNGKYSSMNEGVLPLPNEGEGWGEGESAPSPLAGEGWGEGEIVNELVNTYRNDKLVLSCLGVLTALLLCVSGLPSVVLAEPVSPQIPQTAISAELAPSIVTAAIEPAKPRSSTDSIGLQYFPPDPDGDPGRPDKQTPSGELEGENDEKIQVLDETIVEGMFEDPFATESEPVQDTWEPFNAKIFTLNYNVDRYALKPTARVYSSVIAPDLQDSLANAFDNLGFASRFLNSVFQGKPDRAGTELQRFLLNTTLGVGGLFDVAKYMFDIEAPPVEDAGQTLATYGVGSGPYMVLPLLPPMTVRQAVGYAGDIFMNPVNYFIPFVPNLVLNAGSRMNARAINLETFEGLEESTVDLYGAVRSGYMDRRTKDIQK